MILRIAGLPPRNYYQTPGDRQYLPAGEAPHALLIQPGTLRTTAAGETSNLTILLKRAALRYMTLPPLGAAAVLSSAGVVLHSGRVVRVTFDADAVTVEVQP